MLVKDVGEKCMLVKKSMLVKNFGNVGEGYVGEGKHFHVCW